MHSSSHRRALWIIGALSLGLTAAWALDLVPWLRGDEDWRWPYSVPRFAAHQLPAMVALAVYVLLAAGLWTWAQRSAGERRAWSVVTAAALATVGLQVTTPLLSQPDPLSYLPIRTTSPFVSGFFSQAAQMDDLGYYLRTFPEQLPDDSQPHIQRHPPGLPMYFALLQRGLARFPELAAGLARSLHRYRCEYWPALYMTDAQFAAVVGGLLPILLNAAALWPLYAVGRRLVGRGGALAAVMLSPLVPGYVLWAGDWDSAFALVTALLLGLLYLGVDRRQGWAWWAAGVLLSAATFVKYSAWPLLGLVFFYTAWRLWSTREAERDRWRGLWPHWAGFGLGLGSFWAGYWVLFGVAPWEVFAANTAPHFRMPTNYAWRLIYNPYEFLVFAGAAVGLSALVAIRQAARARLEGRPGMPAQGLVWVATLTIVALAVSGLSRAEVGRVWALLVPLALLVATAMDGGPAASTGRLAATAALLAAQTAVMQTTMFADIGLTHTYTDRLPVWATPVGAQVGDDLELVGVELPRTQAAPGETLELTVHWRARRTPARNYTAFAHLYTRALGLASQQDLPPQAGQYPTTCWAPGEVVPDRVTLPLPPDAAPGDYELIVGLYDPAAGNQRLPTAGPGARDLAVVLATIQVVVP